MVATENEPEPDRVVPFRQRPPSPPKPPVEDLRKFAQGSEAPEDYRHRMRTNVIAFAALAVLVVAGVWIVNVLADMRKAQDCVLSGRRNCAQVDVPPRDRW